MAKCSFTFFRCNVYFLANDDCVTPPFLTQSECRGSSCNGLLKSKWHKIKCFPFSSNLRRSLCSKWCHGGGKSNQSWYNAFHKCSLDRIFCQNGDRQLIFEVVHCRSFEFIIKSKSMAPGKCLVVTFLACSCYYHYYHYCYHYYYFIIITMIILIIIIIIITIISIPLFFRRWSFLYAFCIWKCHGGENGLKNLHPVCISYSNNCLAILVMYCDFATPYQSKEVKKTASYLMIGVVCFHCWLMPSVYKLLKILKQNSLICNWIELVKPL